MMEKSKVNNFFNLLKNYGIYIAVTLLTIILLVFFKYNSGEVENLIENSKNNLLAFYTQNLKPLAYKTNLTNEDVFNFALHNNLPIDKNEQKVLQLGLNENSGNNSFAIKPAVINPDTKNYEKFIQYLRLNGQQIKELDSVLNSYKHEIYASVLLNDHNTVAVNPKISVIRDAVVTDLIELAKKVNYSKVKKVLPENVDFEEEKIKSSIQDVLNTNSNDFIVFTPDTIIQLQCKVDKTLLSHEISGIEELENFDENFKGVDLELNTDKIKEANEKMILDIDSKNLKAVLPGSIYNMKHISYKVDSLENKIAKITDKLNSLSFSLSSDESPVIKMMMNSLNDSINNYTFKFDVNIENMDSLIENSVKINEEIWEEFGLKMDSLAIEMENNWNDSLYWPEKEKMKKEIRQAIIKSKKNIE